MRNTFIGLDIGTTTITGLVCDLDQGQILHRITADHEKGFVKGEQDWERLQDANAIVRQTEQILSELLSFVPEPAGIGLTGQMHGIVYVDGQGRAVSPLYTWQDARGGQPVTGDSRTYAERTAEKIGYPLASGYGLSTHAYNEDHGLVPDSAVSICTIADYAAMRLTGSTDPQLDATQAAAIGGFDLKQGDFDRKAIGHAGLNTGLLPQIVPSGTSMGCTSAGIPVYTSIGDNQASFLGSVANPQTTILLNIGTGSQLSVYLPDSDGLSLNQTTGMELRPYPGGGVLLVGAALSGGKSYAMLGRFFQEVLESFTGQTLQETEVYAFMGRLLLQADGEDKGLSVRPLFLGTRKDANVRGSIEQISLDNFTPGSLAHAFLKGMVEELYDFYSSLQKECPRSFSQLTGSGNSLRLNPALREKAERVFGMPMTLSPAPEEAAVGAALSAAVGSGVVESFAGAGRLVKMLQPAE